MHADTKSRRRASKFHARLKRGAVCQQRCAGHNSVPMSIGYAAIYTLGPSQVIRVDDEIFHVVELNARTTCPLGQLTFRTSRRVCTIDPLPAQL
jgi:hypothetical protein